MNAPPPQYVILQGTTQQGIAIPPPPYYQPAPKYLYNHRKKSSCGSFCFKFICCCYCFLFIIVVVLTILAFYAYTVYQPKIPSYNIDSLEVKSLDFQPPDLKLNTELQVILKADNPNSNIGFTYGNESYVQIIYSDTNICSGNLPSFHQGHKNTTFIKIDMKGKSELGPGLQQAFMLNLKDNRIPLLVRVKVPVRIVVGKFPLRQFKVFVNCSLVVDNLAPDKKIGIVSSKTTFDFQF